MIESNLRRIRSEIAAIALDRECKMIGVTKTVSAERIQKAIDAGLRIFGENRVQEAVPKIQQLPADLEWHFIGHLQTNKVRDAVRYFSWIQSVDSARLLQAIDREAVKQDKDVQVLIQIHLGDEETKHGLDASLLNEVLSLRSELQRTRVKGLMAIPPFFENPEDVRPYFQKLRKLAHAHSLPELSMGMSHDYIVAVEEGATMVRIGTALFGERT